MDNVVYILGAGFSAPLGLPVMSDFWDKAKRMERNEPQKYPHFRKVLDLIDNIATTGNYFEFTPFNIEEALSILEMRGTLGDELSIDDFRQFIRDVITHHTPPVPSVSIDSLPSNREIAMFGSQNHYNLYGSFVASLFGIQLREDRRDYGKRQLWLTRVSPLNVHYSIVTLNYDLVLENFSAFIHNQFPNEKGIHVQFKRGDAESDKDDANVALVKIHGSVDKKDIIPPTLNKGLYQPKLPDEWRRAYEILMDAHHIRIVGYSLPQTDAYIKYLLKAAIGQSGNLEWIDVLCKDVDGKEVENRYRGFIRFKNFRFANVDVLYYLKSHFNRLKHNEGGVLKFDRLEDAHSEFMEKNKA